MELFVKKEDICLIGHTVYNECGNAAFICSTGNNHVEYILLRSILKCFEEEYKVIDSYEIFKNDNDLRSVTDRVYITNLPFEKYMSVSFHY